MRNKAMVTDQASNLNHFSDGQVWNTELAYQKFNQLGEAGTKRTAERRLHELGLWPKELKPTDLRDELKRPLNLLALGKQLEIARSKRKLVLFIQLHKLPNGMVFVHANTAKGGRYWAALNDELNAKGITKTIEKLQSFLNKPLALFPHGYLVNFFRDEFQLQEHNALTAYREILATPHQNNIVKKSDALPPHLVRLEAESIFIFREAIARSKNPAMLYSIGKDSSVMLELAKRAFFPGKLPFPLVHVDTRWKFQSMYDMRNRIAQDPDIKLLIHTNPQAIERDINPFDHGSVMHTEITKTEGLKQVLDQHQFDVIFGGARRDEEKSRAKERIFSLRNIAHHWDPKNQRPELWNLFNTRTNPGESMRVFPLSNWTEIDIWEYIYHQKIPVTPLYFAKKRLIVERNQLLLMLDDERFRLDPKEKVREEFVRFRTLGCYPLTGAIKSTASSVSEIILELLSARQTERQGRAIDSDANASMEKKKQEGYF